MGLSETAATDDPKALDCVVALCSPWRGLETDWWESWPAGRRATSRGAARSWGAAEEKPARTARQRRN